jgi:hypothetical protein
MLLSGAHLQQAVLTGATLRQSNRADVDLTQAKRKGAGPRAHPFLRCVAEGASRVSERLAREAPEMPVTMIPVDAPLS